MNIFVTDPDPKISALNLDDIRGRKMILESTQIVCTNLHLRGKDIGYSPTHANHPCTVWARQSRENIEWLYEHVRWLGETHFAYSGKYHASLALMKRAYGFRFMFTSKGLTPFVNCTSDFQMIDDVHEAYKRQMNKKWQEDLNKAAHRHPTWKLREKPVWADFESYQYPLSQEDFEATKEL